MTNPIIRVNGVDVYSNKKMTSAVGSVVHFEDGSYVDVGSGDVFNNGQGYISLGSQPKNEPAPAKETYSYSGSNLVVTNLVANVKIEPSSEQKDGQIKIVVIAPESQIRDVSVTKDGDTVTIKGKSENNGGATIIQSGNSSMRIGGITGSSVSIGGGGISIVGGKIISGGNTIVVGSKEPEIRIEVIVPLGTNLDISEVTGQVMIEHVLGNLRVRASAGCDVKCGEIKKLNAKVSAGGAVVVQCVNGDSDLKASSGGSIAVKNGRSDNLEASASSGGSIIFQALAQNADLEASSGGSVFARDVVNTPRRHASTGGSVSIGNR